MTKSRHLRAPYRPWTPDEVAMLQRDYADRRTQEIADALGRTYAGVTRRAYELGLTTPQRSDDPGAVGAGCDA